MTQYNDMPSGFTPSNDGSFEDRELGWDDEIQKDGPDYITLPEGDYDFEVVNFERTRHEGSDRLPPCNKAIVHIKIEGKDENGNSGIAMIRHQLFLHSKTEGLLCAFFAGIGQRKKGESLRMNWSLVPGSKGRARIGIRTYEGKKYNEIKRFYEREDKPQAAPQPQQTAFETGKF